jgi:hypothetical protein
MHLLRLPMLSLLTVPFFVAAVALFALGAVLLRFLLFIALAAIAGVLLFGSGILRRIWRGWAWRSRRHPSCRFPRAAVRRRDERPARDFGTGAFDDYRRATARRLDDEACEFRAFLAKLRQAADAADFQDFLKSRRAGRP